MKTINRLLAFICLMLIPAVCIAETASTELFYKADVAYNAAKMSNDAGKRSEYYGEAIANISSAVTLEPENTCYLILASQIYRNKGGLSYAKDYFLRAEKIYQQRLAINPHDIGTRLDYAIACFAGDARYWPEAKSYQAKAYAQAETVINICQSEMKKSQPNGFRLSALAMAYFVKGDVQKGEEALQKSSEVLPTGEFYRTLYDNTAKKGQWYWPVSKDGALREFLLYCLTDETHRPSLEEG